MTKVGIVGGTGYTGSELMRLLAQHPGARVEVLTSRKEAGQRVELVVGAQEELRVGNRERGVGHDDRAAQPPVPRLVRVGDEAELLEERHQAQHQEGAEHPAEEGEGCVMPIAERFGGLGWISLNEDRIRVRKGHREEMQFAFNAADHAKRFTKVYLRMSRCVAEGNENFL